MNVSLSSFLFSSSSFFDLSVFYGDSWVISPTIVFFFDRLSCSSIGHLCKDESSLRPIVARVDRSSPHGHLLLLTVEA
ncbi:hypothetical protein DY000_02035013 [Brassica cretica]|uniref:Secreted protein n=1 Tax=Brassica cretica TaxID=69181 RepID=A0ABQ7DTE7_BRACR|nr:hypothetical protein DY000_02035013 [Brassica cretica]